MEEMEDEQEKNTVFTDLKNEIVEYAELRMQVAKLSTYEIIAKASVGFISAFTLVILFFFFLFFLFLALGFYFGNHFQNNAIGFTIVAGIYLLLICIYLLIRTKLIEKPLSNKIIETLAQGDDEED
jgi:hypothetical protein